MVKPLYDNLLIKQKKAEEKTASGLYLSNPDVGLSYAEGVVVSTGEGYRLSTTDKLYPLTVREGDTVVYRKGSEISLKDDGEEYFLISEGNVLAVKN